MAATQHGTGGLTAAGQAAKAALYITIPAGTIIESLSVSNGGSPIYEDIFDEDGAHHTRIVFEAGMHTASVVMVGKALVKGAGVLDGSGTDYFIESCTEETSRGPVRTTVNVTSLPTVT